MLDQIENQLASHGKEWFLGERYGALDAWAFLMGRWTRFFGRPARGLAGYGGYLGRMLERGAVRRVIGAEGLVAPIV
jgi:glutathione S-transferase